MNDAVEMMGKKNEVEYIFYYISFDFSFSYYS